MQQNVKRYSINVQHVCNQFVISQCSSVANVMHYGKYESQIPIIRLNLKFDEPHLPFINSVHETNVGEIKNL